MLYSECLLRSHYLVKYYKLHVYGFAKTAVAVGIITLDFFTSGLQKCAQRLCMDIGFIFYVHLEIARP